MFTQQGDHYQDLLPCPPRPILMDRIWKPNVELAPNCPRCDSSNTKFCYYNNYSLTQPRYFCKGCRRYWTKGGSLRNVPVGGGCRKNRRGKSVRISTNRTSSPGTTSTYGGGGGGCSLSNMDHLGLPRESSIDHQNLASNVMVSSSSSTNHPDSSNIDLALVYAKFLNHQPDCNSRVPSNIPTEVPRDQFNSSFEFSSIVSECPNNEAHNIHLSQEQYMVIGSSSLGTSSDIPSQEPQLSEGRQVFLGEHHQLDLNYKQRLVQERIPQFTNLETSSYLLQPILPPSEEVVLQDNLWLNSPISGSNFTWQPPTPVQGFEPMVDDQSTVVLHSNPLDNNWTSSFDLPSYEAFPRQ